MFGRIRSQQSGQATIEYLLVLGVVAALALGLTVLIRETQMGTYFTQAIKDGYRRAYQYGNPKTVGYEEGGPEKHARATSEGNFRIFINSGKQ